MNKDILNYNGALSVEAQSICELISTEISKNLTNAESKIWHAHPVWFLNGNPIVGYSKQKAGIRLMFWSGIDFEEDKLNVQGKKFKDASVFYNSVEEINTEKKRRFN
ncbi:MAG: DUF1801 domain-containing protein [Myroides sp.]